MITSIVCQLQYQISGAMVRLCSFLSTSSKSNHCHYHWRCSFKQIFVLSLQKWKTTTLPNFFLGIPVVRESGSGVKSPGDISMTCKEEWYLKAVPSCDIIPITLRRVWNDALGHHLFAINITYYILPSYLLHQLYELTSPAEFYFLGTFRMIQIRWVWLVI